VLLIDNSHRLTITFPKIPRNSPSGEIVSTQIRTEAPAGPRVDEVPEASSLNYLGNTIRQQKKPLDAVASSGLQGFGGRGVLATAPRE
jgi:hypothetical protein